ncbi:hypothetical protein MYU51_019459 [Penicillium brevicompactum]
MHIQQDTSFANFHEEQQQYRNAVVGLFEKIRHSNEADLQELLETIRKPHLVSEAVQEALATSGHRYGDFIAEAIYKTKGHYDACSIASRPHRLHSMNGGVYGPLDVRIARSFLIMTVQFPVTGGSSRAFGSQKLPGAPSAAYSKRQPESATNWRQHHVNMNGDYIDEDNCKRSRRQNMTTKLIDRFVSSEVSANFMNSAPHSPVTQVECEASNLVCSTSSIPMRSHAVFHLHMTAGGIDDESLKSSDRLPRPFS